jgi:RNA ligase
VSRFDRERLDALVADGWLRSQRHPDADLWIYNYTEKTQYEKHWIPETLVCRGLILDQAGRVIARPFSKFFNYGDPQVPSIPDEPFIVMEKMDGSLGILYYLDGVKDHRNSSELLMRIPHLVVCATCCVSGFVEAVA